MYLKCVYLYELSFICWDIFSRLMCKRVQCVLRCCSEIVHRECRTTSPHKLRCKAIAASYRLMRCCLSWILLLLLIILRGLLLLVIAWSKLVSIACTVSYWSLFFHLLSKSSRFMITWAFLCCRFHILNINSWSFKCRLETLSIGDSWVLKSVFIHISGEYTIKMLQGFVPWDVYMCIVRERHMYGFESSSHNNGNHRRGACKSAMLASFLRRPAPLLIGGVLWR